MRVITGTARGRVLKELEGLEARLQELGVF